MDKESQIIISKILKFSEMSQIQIDSNNSDKLENYLDIFDILKIDNPIHSVILKSLSQSLLEGIIKNNKNNSGTKQKLKYKSRIDTDNMESVINLSLWKNAPNTSNMFDLYEMKKNNFINLPKNNNQSNTYSNIPNSSNPNNKLNSENIEEEDESVNKKFKNKFRYNNNFKKSENQDDREEARDISEKFHQTNNYMCNQVNLKRKK